MNVAIKQKFKIIIDKSGNTIELPGLLLNDGPYIPLVRYLHLKYLEGYSYSWMNKVVQVTRLFFYFLGTTTPNGKEGTLIFTQFVSALHLGTIKDGKDPSGLYWKPNSRINANLLINSLNGFLDYVSEFENIKHINPSFNSSNFTKGLSEAALKRKSQNSILGHLQGKRSVHKMNQSRMIQLDRVTSMNRERTFSFPAEYFEDFFEKGFFSNNKGSSLRNQLILLLMHYGGLRLSEALSIWQCDISISPFDYSSVSIYLHHPELGIAPYNWRSRDGSSSRASFLDEVYDLKPRNRLMGNFHLGWKSSHLQVIEVYWVPKEAGKLFLEKWSEYSFYIPKSLQHPYAFISLSGKSWGQPFSINSFKDAYKKALSKIGLHQNKYEGLSPHSHRHSYGQRLSHLGLDSVFIKKCLHHSSLESQLVYTEPSSNQINSIIKTAANSLEASHSLKHTHDWNFILRYGFQDIDPSGLLSGQTPLLGNKDV